MNILYLKIIALTSMIIDHYGAIFHNDVIIYRVIGRLAFPIYCFLLVEGYFHTSDVKKYAKRLFIFALISEIPFDLAFYDKIGFVHQNIFFTLLIGLITIYLIDKKYGKHNFNKTAVIIASGFLSVILSVDYNIIGITYILAFYYTRDFIASKKYSRIALIMFLANLLSVVIQQFSIVSLFILYYYNGKLGPKTKLQQLLFYAAYPLHLIIFYVVKLMS